MHELSTALYYTLSTVSQTLAGALGLFAAFMVIRIGAFNQLIYERMTELHSELSYADAGLQKARASGDARFVFAFYRNHQEKARPTGGLGNPPRMPLNDAQEIRLSEGEAMVQRKAVLLGQIGRVLLASGITIVLCFAGLALTPAAADNSFTAAVVLGVAVLLGGWCVGWLLVVMNGALREA